MDERSMLSDVNSDTPIAEKALGKRHGVRYKDKIVYKIVMGGGSNRGTTSFINRFLTGKFHSTTPTIGVDFALKHLEMDDGRNVTLQLWDIAGQERTQTMNRMYYQDAHACVIMFDVTYDKSLEICLKWKQDLDSKCTLDSGEPIPCILLANKVDLANKRKFTTDDIRTFAEENNFLHFMETSVRNNVNVEESMRYLVDNLLTHEDLPRRRRVSSDIIVDPQLPPEPQKKSGCC